MLNNVYPDGVNTLRLSFIISQYFIERGEKTFSILPNRKSFGLKHIKIDTCALYKTLSLFKSTNVTEKNFIDNKDTYWKKLFYVDKFETINRKFANEIVTDGRSVSILLQKPKIEKKTNQEIDTNDYDVVWGLDPGRCDLFVASDCNDNMIKCSVGEYYNDAKFLWCRQKISRWYNSNNYKVRDILNRTPSLKITDIESMGLYLAYMFKNIDSLLHKKLSWY